MKEEIKEVLEEYKEHTDKKIAEIDKKFDEKVEEIKRYFDVAREDKVEVKQNLIKNYGRRTKKAKI